MVETKTPNISEIAIPWKMGSNKIAVEPTTKANAVIIIGRVLVIQAIMIASLISTPRLISWRE